MDRIMQILIRILLILPICGPTSGYTCNNKTVDDSICMPTFSGLILISGFSMTGSDLTHLSSQTIEPKALFKMCCFLANFESVKVKCCNLFASICGQFLDEPKKCNGFCQGDPPKRAFGLLLCAMGYNCTNTPSPTDMQNMDNNAGDFLDDAVNYLKSYMGNQ